MDFLTKWQLKQTLSEEEAILVLEELFKGANKEFVFDSSTKLDKNLYKIFEKFSPTQSEVFLKFSQTLCDLPFVSLTKFETLSPQHIISTEKNTIYIY